MMNYSSLLLHLRFDVEDTLGYFLLIHSRWAPIIFHLENEKSMNADYLCYLSSAYNFNIWTSIKVHVVFHASCFKELISCHDNVVSIKELVIEDFLRFERLKLERFLASKSKCLWSKNIQDFQIKWIDGSEVATWEWEYSLENNFLDFSLQECKILEHNHMNYKETW